MRAFEGFTLKIKAARESARDSIRCNRYDHASELILENPGVIAYDATLRPNEYATLLHWTLHSPDAPLWFVELLVDQCADVNANTVDDNGSNQTPLGFAHDSIPKDVVHFMLDCGGRGGANSAICCVKDVRKQLHNKNIALAWALKQQGVPKDLINQIGEEFWELRTEK